MEKLYLSYSSILSTTEKPGHYIHNKCRETLGDEKKKTEWIGSSGPEKCVLFFCLIYPKSRADKTNNLELQMDTNQKGSNKILLSG